MRSLFLAALLLFAPFTAQASVSVVGADGNQIEIADASRIVALGGDVTEVIYALGAGERVIAADTTSIYPAEAFDLPKVGYVRNVAAEGLLSLGPTLIIANGDAGPPATLEQIESVGVPVLRLGDDNSVDTIGWKIRTIGAALSLGEAAEALASDVEARIDAATVQPADDATRVPVMFVLNAGSGAPMGAGRGTRADTLITLAGGHNVFSGFEGYRPLSPEAAVAAAPEAIIMMNHTFETLGGLAGVRGHPALRLTPAAQEGRIIAMDGLLLLGFGPRTPDAIEAVREGLQAPPMIN